jgi:hypothetical protein
MTVELVGGLGKKQQPTEGVCSIFGFREFSVWAKTQGKKGIRKAENVTRSRHKEGQKGKCGKGNRGGRKRSKTTINNVRSAEM